MSDEEADAIFWALYLETQTYEEVLEVSLAIMT